MPPRSPLAPETSPSLPPLAGVRLATRACGVRYQGRMRLLRRMEAGVIRSLEVEDASPTSSSS